MNDYYTHREYLKKELTKIKKSENSYCLEFGTGDGSGLIFSEILKTNDKMSVVAYDSDASWLNKTKETYGNDNYQFIHVNNWNEILKEKNFDKIYDLVFVDQAPWEARINSIDTIMKKAKTIILHDYDYFNIGVCDDIYSVNEGSFFHTKYGEHFDLIGYKEQLPPTLVMINKKL